LDPYPNGLALIFLFLGGIGVDVWFAHYNGSRQLLTTPFAQFAFAIVGLIIGVALLGHAKDGNHTHHTHHTHHTRMKRGAAHVADGRGQASSSERASDRAIERASERASDVGHPSFPT
jgi:hypothetical protein